MNGPYNNALRGKINNGPVILFKTLHLHNNEIRFLMKVMKHEAFTVDPNAKTGGTLGNSFPLNFPPDSLSETIRLVSYDKSQQFISFSSTEKSHTVKMVQSYYPYKLQNILTKMKMFKISYKF